MILALSTFFSLIGRNLKWVAIILGILIVSFIGWKFYSMTLEVASSKAEISRLTTEIAYKNLAIELYKSNAESVQEALLERDQSIRLLEDQLQDLHTDLPSDVSEEAPLSTQEFIERLRRKLR